jgi:hypothetical protein
MAVEIVIVGQRLVNFVYFLTFGGFVCCFRALFLLVPSLFHDIGKYVLISESYLRRLRLLLLLERKAFFFPIAL